MRNRTYVAGLYVGFAFSSAVFAQEQTSKEAAKVPQSSPANESSVSEKPNSPSVNSDSEVVFRSVPAKTLTAMRMHSATNPEEAALRCSIMDSCILGLTRGFAIGGDVSGMLSALVVQPQVQAGAWLLTDAFVSYQFFDSVEKVFNANGSIGYRTFRYEDSNGNVQKSGGISLRFNYAQDISPEYTQGLIFSGTISSWNSVDPEERIYSNEASSPNARRALRNFYRYSQRYPTFWLSFPADVEVINWKASHIDLPNHLRGYGHLEPSFVQNQFRLSNDAFLWVERNLGLRTAATLAYESRPDRVSGRFAVQSTFGLEFSTSSHTVDAPRTAKDVLFDLPARPPVAPYLDIEASWQF